MKPLKAMSLEEISALRRDTRTPNGIIFELSGELLRRCEEAEEFRKYVAEQCAELSKKCDKLLGRTKNAS